MKKLCFILLFLWGAVAKAQAPHIYITPTGSTTGSCPTGANIHNPAWFNTAGNWGSGAGQIGPGTTVLLCGTFTSSSGSSILIAQGSGTTGSPVTILFDTNAVLTSPGFTGKDNGGGALIIGGHSYIVVDGGTNGLIQNTNAGSSLSHPSNFQSLAVNAGTNNVGGCTPGCRVTNLTVANMFVHIASPVDCSDDQTNTNAITINGAVGIRVDHNTFHDMGWAISYITGSLEMDHNNIYNVDHGIAAGATADAFGVLIHDNHIHDYANWDTGFPANCYHHDGIHFFTNPNQISGAMVYNNLFDGNAGVNKNAQIYLEDNWGTPNGARLPNFKIFNNVFTEPSIGGQDGIQPIWMTAASPRVFNNTIYSPDTNVVGLRFFIGQDIVWENNIFNGTNTFFYFQSGTTSNITTADYNRYENHGAGGNNAWHIQGGVDTNVFATWQSTVGESHSQSSATTTINSDGTLQSGSPVINAGVNLTSQGIAALNSDKNGVARPSSGAWTMGAFNFTAGGTPLIAISPSSNNFGSVTQNVTSSPVTFTISNPGTANLILGSTCCSTSGTNGTDFVITGQTCSNNQVIAPSGSCTVTLTFTPKTIGAETGVLQIGSNAATGGNANLSGTGTAPGTAVASLSPNPVNFGSVTTGTTSPAQTVTLNNTGTANLTLGNPTFYTVTSPWAVTGGTCSAGQIIAPGGASCTFTITFAPSTTGAQTSTFTVLGNVNGSTTLNGTGAPPPTPSLTVTPAAFNFGNQLKGTTSPLQNFTITNVGGAAATFGPSYFSFTGGSNPADFARVSPGGSDCTNGGVLLAGASCLISVAFTPTTASLESTGLNILSNAPTVSSSLTGTGVFPVITITPNPIAFGSINQGTSSMGKVVTIQNTGTATETFTGTPITVTGPSGAYFAPSAITCSGTLAVNATCTATVTFTPGAAGSFTDTFNVNGNGAGTAPLTGTGIAINPVITLSPRPVTFPSTAIGATSSQVTVTVSNAAGTASEVLANPFFTITTGDSSDFAKVGGTCSNSGTILTGASCTIIFTFMPTGAARLEQTLLTVNGTVSSNVAMQGLGLTVNPAPLPWSIVSIAFSNNYQTVSVIGKGFTRTNVITVQGLPVPTSCTATACTATVTSAPVWLPFTNGALTIGVQ